MRAVHLAVAAFALVPAASLLGGCEGAFLPDPVLYRDTVTMAAPTSTSRLPSAIDLGEQNAPRRPELPIDAELWDLQLRQQGGTLVLLPNPVRDVQRPAGIAVAGGEFESLEDAPLGRSNYSEVAVPLQVGVSYFAHSRDVGQFGCYRYAKFKVLALDPAAGTAQLVFVSNQDCDDERLKGDSDDEF